ADGGGRVRGRGPQRAGASAVLVVMAVSGAVPASAQRPAPPPAPAPLPEVLPSALEAMIESERAFAMRAIVVGWKQAFLDYFSDSAVGYDGENVGSAKD